MLTLDKKQKIKKLTQFSYEEIMNMTHRQFFFAITSLLSKQLLTQQQHDWLEKQRDEYGLNKEDKEILNIFGGKVIKE